MAAAAVEADSPRSRAVEPRPLIAKAATIQQPVRAGESTGQHVVAGWLGKGVAEFEPWRLPRTFGRRKNWPLLSRLVEKLNVELDREESRSSAP